MQAQFKQTLYDANGDPIQHAAGSMALVRPGQFRWQIQGRNAQLIVVDGQHVWTYDPGLQQATEEKMPNSAKTSPAFLLTGSTQAIADDFKITTLKGKYPQTYRLFPKDNNSLFTWVELGFNNHQLKQMILQDQLGQQTVIQFSNIKWNGTVDPKAFQFSPPKGVDVIRQ